MAQRVLIELVCDFCASGWSLGSAGGGDEPATDTIEVSVNGPIYTVDLCDKHAAGLYEMRDLVQRTGRTERRGVRREKPRPYNAQTKDPKRSRTQQLQRVRAWARGNGYEVTNARIPYRVQRAYNDAHPDDQVALADGGRGTSAGQSAWQAAS